VDQGQKTSQDTSEFCFGWHLAGKDGYFTKLDDNGNLLFLIFWHQISHEEDQALARFPIRSSFGGSRNQDSKFRFRHLKQKNAYGNWTLGYIYLPLAMSNLFEG
jgi:hypothetical protein